MTFVTQICYADMHVKMPPVPAGVDVALAYGASKEALTSVAAGSAIMFPRGFVSTDRTVTTHCIWTR